MGSFNPPLRFKEGVEREAERIRLLINEEKTLINPPKQYVVGKNMSPYKHLYSTVSDWMDEEDEIQN